MWRVVERPVSVWRRCHIAISGCPASCRAFVYVLTASIPLVSAAGHLAANCADTICQPRGADETFLTRAIADQGRKKLVLSRTYGEIFVLSRTGLRAFADPISCFRGPTFVLSRTSVG